MVGKEQTNTVLQKPLTPSARKQVDKSLSKRTIEQRPKEAQASIIQDKKPDEKNPHDSPRQYSLRIPKSILGGIEIDPEHDVFIFRVVQLPESSSERNDGHDLTIIAELQRGKKSASRQRKKIN